MYFFVDHLRTFQPTLWSQRNQPLQYRDAQDYIRTWPHTSELHVDEWRLFRHSCWPAAWKILPCKQYAKWRWVRSGNRASTDCRFLLLPDFVWLTRLYDPFSVHIPDHSGKLLLCLRQLGGWQQHKQYRGVLDLVWGFDCQLHNLTPDGSLHSVGLIRSVQWLLPDRQFVPEVLYEVYQWSF